MLGRWGGGEMERGIPGGQWREEEEEEEEEGEEEREEEEEE